MVLLLEITGGTPRQAAFPQVGVGDICLRITGRRLIKNANPWASFQTKSAFEGFVI
jgi:hypothetical protein